LKRALINLNGVNCNLHGNVFWRILACEEGVFTRGIAETKRFTDVFFARIKIDLSMIFGENGKNMIRF